MLNQSSQLWITNISDLSGYYYYYIKKHYYIITLVSPCSTSRLLAVALYLMNRSESGVNLFLQLLARKQISVFTHHHNTHRVTGRGF